MNGGTRVRPRSKICCGTPESIPKELNVSSGSREGEQDSFVVLFIRDGKSERLE